MDPDRLTHDAAADRDDCVRTGKAVFKHRFAEHFQGSEALAFFTLRNDDLDGGFALLHNGVCIFLRNTVVCDNEDFSI